MLKQFLAAATALAIILPLAAQEEGDFPGVKGLMSAQEYEDAGLQKLNPEERKALDAWLLRYTAWDAPEILKTVEEVKEVEKQLSIESSIKPPFKGWSTKTYFYLENGQVWQQRTAGRYYYTGEDTSVRITKNSLGFYEMELLAPGKSVDVKRVK
ncbi:hypothetical protein EY643_00485 [Halioglobus maricola]|uniref:Uncharacterized protein n=1 Tax=Halioglobus maricola TaxID=2601894 RepID=A0A5P9NGC7_9GAMM|nr:hypothetical protein [Halioglobus maricola]QFU74244.1 hypothetical protein EY643_00485 [Halioglobus maricola]